ncbi:MucBP domain-containing protein [Lactiplantibacillus mudanjiangensis]|uniref:MucBP domain-containing protein n=1 Tax=Lactiplantibacillus mudanjiangensis TaxID=1296538 RepID=A0A660E628_9LACO|nr:MucBP domain-containing protein [Lactiplantibacillus mudanjiangensis]VDG23510.1 hypothetical protein MUDAN_IGPPGNFN_02097 [Lactiplantibacillus mudanjiangensis]VDG27727.1 hypothetical protein MUDAN_MDHGFNIF_02559 [Lactiplantibacillus mudanjiangensis]VDG32796.1 hypothetical protein MUDAN_DOGOELCO_02044 [Lactiplantibacillus mudanjiangensis]
MHFFDRLKGMLQALDSNTETPKTVNQAPVLDPGEPDMTTPVVNQTPALVLVHHVDQAGQELQAPEMIAGTIGDEIHLPDVNLSGYHLMDIQGLTRWFTTERARIVLTYEREAGQPIWVYAYDIDQRQLIGLPVMHRGRLGDPYQVTAPTVAGFKLLRSVGDLTGEYTTTSKTVLFFYRNANWRQTDLSTGYVQIKTATKVYPYPGATTTNYWLTLPVGAIYKTFMRVQLNDESTWYTIGEDQWIAEKHVQLTNSNQLLPPTPAAYETRHKKQVHQTGIVSFVPGKQVHTYLEPYGRYLTTVTHGDTVNLTERLVDDNRVVWYRIQDRGYLPGRYLTHLDPPDYWD